MGGEEGRAEREESAWRAVEKINGSWLAKDWRSLESLMDAEITMALPGFSSRLVGKEAVLQSFVGFAGACEMLQFLVLSREVDIAGRTAVVSFTFTMTYVRSGRAHDCKGRDVWVLEERASPCGGDWAAVWRTMMDMEECPLVSVSPMADTQVADIESLVKRLSSELLPAIDLDAKFADADEGDAAPKPLQPSVHFPGVTAPTPGEGTGGVLSRPLSDHCAVLVATTEAEGMVGALAWQLHTSGTAAPCCEVTLLAFPQDDSYVATALLLAAVDAFAGEQSPLLSVRLHEDLEEAVEALLALGFCKGACPVAGYSDLCFVARTPSQDAQS